MRIDADTAAMIADLRAQLAESERQRRETHDLCRAGLRTCQEIIKTSRRGSGAHETALEIKHALSWGRALDRPAGVKAE